MRDRLEVLIKLYIYIVLFLVSIYYHLLTEVNRLCSEFRLFRSMLPPASNQNLLCCHFYCPFTLRSRLQYLASMARCNPVRYLVVFLTRGQTHKHPSPHTHTQIDIFNGIGGAFKPSHTFSSISYSQASASSVTHA